MKLIDFAESPDQPQQNGRFLLHIQLAGDAYVLILEGPFHAGDGGEVSEHFLSRPHDHLLRELVVVVEVGEQREEGVVVEDAHVVGLVLVENVRKVYLQQALQQRAEHRVEAPAFLHRFVLTRET